MSKFHYKDSASERDKKAFVRFLAEDEELILATGMGKAYIRSIFIVGLAWPGAIMMGLGMGMAYFLTINLGIGLLLGFLLAIFVAILKAYITYQANRYLLTTRRLIIKQGFFAVKITAALFDKITHIEVIQSFFDKILMHHGVIIINTAGTNKGEIIIKFIDYPIEFKNLLERLINREREQFGGRSDPVVTLEGEIV